MTDEYVDDPGPVAEYRDPELAARFDAEPVPDHRPGFWAELESSLQTGVEAGTDETDGVEPGFRLHAVGGDRGLDTGAGSDPGRPEGAILGAVAAPESAMGPGDRRWGPARWLAVAAGVLMAAGIGAAALLAGDGGSAPVESAAPTPSSDPPSTSTTIDPSTTELVTTESTERPATTTTAPADTGAATTVADDGAGVDLLAVEVGARAVGSGHLLGFSPDDSTVLVVDDAPGVGRGCEGAELLALYAQDLASGRRTPALGDGATVETGGLSLLISPFEASPPSVGTRPVYWIDWCDGTPGAVRRGVLAADGRITMVEPVATGSDDDPFADQVEARAQGVGQVSPDGSRTLVVDDGTAEVVSIDGGTPTTWELPVALAGAAVSSGAWSPDGQVVALGTDDSVIVWSPDTGRHRVFDSGRVLGLVFANDGRRLAVTSMNGTGPTGTVLSFGPLPEPAPAPPRCSGAVDLAPIESSGSSDRPLPERVAATAAAIDRAAAACDWDALDGLTGPAFTASFGGDDPVPLWRAQEVGGGSPMWYLRTLLRLAPAVDGAIGDPTDPARWVWPSFHLSPDCEFDTDDRAALEALGEDPDRVEADCRTVGGYLGYRTAIDETGAWRSFVAGD